MYFKRKSLAGTKDFLPDFLPVLEANKKNCDHAGIILFILFFIFCRPDIVCSAKYTFNWLKVVE